MNMEANLSRMSTQLSLNDQLSSDYLFEAFKTQLAKDFEQSNYPADFVHKLPADYHEIHRQLVHELERHEKRTDSSLMQLLYRVDISEAQLKRCLQQSQEGHLATIAELIIKRVLQKVVTREAYKRR